MRLSVSRSFCLENFSCCSIVTGLERHASSSRQVQEGLLEHDAMWIPCLSSFFVFLQFIAPILPIRVCSAQTQGFCNYVISAISYCPSYDVCMMWMFHLLGLVPHWLCGESLTNLKVGESLTSWANFWGVAGLPPGVRLVGPTLQVLGWHRFCSKEIKLFSVHLWSDLYMHWLSYMFCTQNN